MQPTRPSAANRSQVLERELAHEEGAPPRHGYQGDRGAAPPPPSVPAKLTLAVSRESGARGGTIGRRVARLLGWPVYDQELLEYMAQESNIQQNVFDTLPPAEAAWAAARLAHLQRREVLSQQPMFLNLVRVVLALGSQGGVVLIGRGGGAILPPESTLHARIVAPLADRVAYMQQWLRLSEEESADRVTLRDKRRIDFLRGCFQCEPDDVHQYDLTLNSSFLGEGLCVELLVQATRSLCEAGLPKRRGALAPGAA